MTRPGKTDTLVSPATGLALRPDTLHSLSDGLCRWPVIDGIAFLRVGREALAAEALAALDRGARDEALALLLADQDDWWRGGAPSPADLAWLVSERDHLSLREAMALLAWGPVGTYFAHRWSDPTFLAGLALVEAHWTAPRSAFELACGIGHHLRELDRRGVRVSGGDIVFAKLWVARHWVVPRAELVCFDAAAPWPIEGRHTPLACCHDAFYFLEPKALILQRLRRLVGDGLIAVSHVHNSDWPNLSAGSALSAEAFAGLFPDGHLYDDAETLDALTEGRAPVAATAASLAGVEAFSVAAGPGAAPARPVVGGLALPLDGSPLRRNPLYEDGAVRWPSDRYAREYGPRATFPERSVVPAQVSSGDADREAVLRRELVDLPERW